MMIPVADKFNTKKNLKYSSVSFYIYIYTRKEPTQARKYFMIVNLPLFCI